MLNALRLIYFCREFSFDWEFLLKQTLLEVFQYSLWNFIFTIDVNVFFNMLILLHNQE